MPFALARMPSSAQVALDSSGVLVQYKDGEPVRLWVNKVGPYDNPQETYNYYYLPFCAPRDAGKPKHKWGGLGEVLQGNELIDSQLEVKFKGRLSLLFIFPNMHGGVTAVVGDSCECFGPTSVLSLQHLTSADKL